MLWLAENAKLFGVEAVGVKAQIKDLMALKDAIVDMLTGSPRLKRMLERSNITYLKGQASFFDSHTIKVGAQSYRTKQIVLAGGSDPFVPPIPGLKGTEFINSIDASQLKTLPKKIAIVGGGAVGCEYAQFFIRMHSQVWLIQRSDRILDREDHETSAAIRQSFKIRG